MISYSRYMSSYGKVTDFTPWVPFPWRGKNNIILAHACFQDLATIFFWSGDLIKYWDIFTDILGCEANTCGSPWWYSWANLIWHPYNPANTSPRPCDHCRLLWAKDIFLTACWSELSKRVNSHEPRKNPVHYTGCHCVMFFTIPK